MPGFAFTTDVLADESQLLRHTLVGGDDVIKGVGNPTADPLLICGQPDRKIAAPDRVQRMQQRMVEGAVGSRDPRDCRTAHCGFGSGIGIDVGRQHRSLLWFFEIWFRRMDLREPVRVPTVFLDGIGYWLGWRVRR